MYYYPIIIMSHIESGHGGPNKGLIEEVTEKSVGKTFVGSLLLPFLWFFIIMDKNPVEE
jgi:hypothetical protein